MTFSCVFISIQFGLMIGRGFFIILLITELALLIVVAYVGVLSNECKKLSRKGKYH